LSKPKQRTKKARTTPENLAILAPETAENESNVEKLLRQHGARYATFANFAPEPRATDDGFAFPIGENAEIADASYFCAAADCPGYPYRASDQPHPEMTCGGIENSSDSAKEENISVVEPTEPHNEIPENTAPTPIANDSPAMAGETLPEIEEGQSPVTEDDSGLPTANEIILPRLLLSSAERAHYLVDSHPAVDSCWAQPNEFEVWVHCYHVTGVNAAEGFALCEIQYDVQSLGFQKWECLVRLAHFTNGDLAPFLTKPYFVGQAKLGFGSPRSVYPVLDAPQKRGLRESNVLNSWVPILGTWWLEELPSPQTGAVYRVQKINEDVVRRANVDDVAVVIFYPDGSRVRAVAPFEKFLDGTFQFLDRVGELPPWVAQALAADPPMPTERPSLHPTALRDPAAGTVEVSSLASIAAMCDDLATSLDVAPSHVYRLLDGGLMTASAVVAMKELTTTSPAVAAFLSAVQRRDVMKGLAQWFRQFNSDAFIHFDEAQEKIVNYINQKIEPRLEQIETRLGDETVPPLEQLEHVRKTSANLYESVLGDMDGIIKRLEVLENERMAVNEDLSRLKASRLPNVNTAKPKVDKEEKLASRRRKDRALREKKQRNIEGLRRANATARVTPSMDDDDDVEQLSKPTIGRPIGSTYATGANRSGTKKGGLLSRKRGPGRPPGSKKTKQKTTTMAGPASVLVSFMGNATDPKILALLNRIPSSQRGRFIEQAKRGMPDLKPTGWNSREQTTFARWYFLNRRR